MTDSSTENVPMIDKVTSDQLTYGNVGLIVGALVTSDGGADGTLSPNPVESIVWINSSAVNLQPMVCAVWARELDSCRPDK